MTPKPKTSRDHYAEWVKKLPKGTIVKTHFDADVFCAVAMPASFFFKYEDITKKPKKPKS